jgi:hypothetical protein
VDDESKRTKVFILNLSSTRRDGAEEEESWVGEMVVPVFSDVTGALRKQPDKQ